METLQCWTSGQIEAASMTSRTRGTRGVDVATSWTFLDMIGRDHVVEFDVPVGTW